MFLVGLETRLDDNSIGSGQATSNGPLWLSGVLHSPEYNSIFDTLSNRLRGLCDSFRLSYFLGGLRDDIRLPVGMLNLDNILLIT